MRPPALRSAGQSQDVFGSHACPPLPPDEGSAAITRFIVNDLGQLVAVGTLTGNHHEHGRRGGKQRRPSPTCYFRSTHGTVIARGSASFAASLMAVSV
jgi:hypothetical protein